MTDATPASTPPKKGLGSWILLAVILIGVPFGGLALLWKDRCKETPLGSVLSPDGRFGADTVALDCGPAMKVATEVRLAKREGETRAGETTVFLFSGPTALDISWTAANKVLVKAPADAVVVKRRVEWEDVKVEYDGPVPKARYPDLQPPRPAQAPSP